jgi:4-amino-4-deoxy-L-arabinose transferase-like glycosyltransferase
MMSIKIARTKYQDWIVLSLIMLTAMAIRFRFDNACNYLLIGSDGPYYPLQVRSILEKGRLAFPDMPLVFWLQALVAKLFALFNPIIWKQIY